MTIDLAAFKQGLLRLRRLPDMAQQSLLGRIRKTLFGEPLEPILHPSERRLKSLGIYTLVGHPLIWLVWTYWMPQPYENIWIRLAIALLGLGLIHTKISKDYSGNLAKLWFTGLFWLQLPFFFTWMYLCNQGNSVWLASFSGMLLIYYHVTDWRLATIGTFFGVVSAYGMFNLVQGPNAGFSFLAHTPDVVVVLFFWCCAVVLGVSSANLRRDQLAHTLASMGIMAHELRSPLATVGLVGDALRNEAEQGGHSSQAVRLFQLSTRLHALVRNMNHQINGQIANARVLNLPNSRETILTSVLIREVLCCYPFRSARERDCVELQVRQDFVFEASQALFMQVFNNLFKNSFRAIAARSSAPSVGDLRVELSFADGRGRITVTDQGVGIESNALRRVFEPFFSTNHGTGHGLGLTFCRQVILAAGGSIRVHSEAGAGATFVIELPARLASGEVA